MSDSWPTAITEIKPNEVRVCGYDIADLMGNSSFGEVVYLLFTGEWPTKEIGHLIEAIIVSSIDHGVTPPSIQSARTVSSTGASLSASVAAGIMSINRHHGGAIENCASQLSEIIKLSKDFNLEKAVEQKISMWKSLGVRVSGFGHRIHSADPRTIKIFELGENAGVNGEHVQAAKMIEKVFMDSGKNLPINVDGAIAAILADLKIKPEFMNGFFMIARTPGLIAHACEERARMKPMRKIDSSKHIYDGPAARELL